MGGPVSLAPWPSLFKNYGPRTQCCQTGTNSTHTFTDIVDRLFHRRKIYTEAKAKVVASVWGAPFIQFLAALAILPIGLF